MIHKVLLAGDTRQKGDEIQHVDVSKRGLPCKGLLEESPFYAKRPSYLYIDDKQREPILGPWEPVQLIEHKILESDLMIANFRRPV
jgi:hypothetical protein